MRPLIASLVAIIIGCHCTNCDAQAFRRGGYNYYPAPRPLVAPAVQAKPVNRLDQKMDGHVGYNSGDVADMPMDRLYMTLVTSDDWATDPGPRGVAQRKLKAWLENDPRLLKYRKESNWNWYTASDPHFTAARTLANGQASSLKARLGEAYPILAIETAAGEAKFKMSAMSLPATSGELADWVTSSIKAQTPAPPSFFGQTEATPIVTEAPEQCGPDNCPPVQPPVTPDNSEVINDTPRPNPAGDYAGLAVLGVFTAGAAGLGAVAARRPGLKR